MSFLNYRLQNACLCKCLKSNVFVHPRTVNMLKCPKYCCNMNDTSFISFDHYFWKIWVGKSFF